MTCESLKSANKPCNLPFLTFCGHYTIKYLVRLPYADVKHGFREFLAQTVNHRLYVLAVGFAVEESTGVLLRNFDKLINRDNQLFEAHLYWYWHGVCRVKDSVKALKWVAGRRERRKY